MPDWLPAVAHGSAIVLGWALLTWGVASFTRVVEVYPVSGGLFLLSLAGWRHLLTLFGAGLYALHRKGRER